MMSELEALRRISAYIAENKINSALEAEENMAVEPKPPDKNEVVKVNVDKQRLD